MLTRLIPIKTDCTSAPNSSFSEDSKRWRQNPTDIGWSEKSNMKLCWKCPFMEIKFTFCIHASSSNVVTVHHRNEFRNKTKQNRLVMLMRCLSGTECVCVCVVFGVFIDFRMGTTVVGCSCVRYLWFFAAHKLSTCRLAFGVRMCRHRLCAPMFGVHRILSWSWTWSWCVCFCFCFCFHHHHHIEMAHINKN